MFISWASGGPGVLRVSASETPQTNQTFAWWELSFHIPETSECLLCAQHWAKLWGSSESCTPPVSSADLQPVRGLCSQKLVQGSGKGEDPAEPELLANDSTAFSGPKFWCRGGARWSEGTPLPLSAGKRPTTRWGWPCGGRGGP